MLNTNKGRIHRAEKVAERTGEVHDQTHLAAFSWPPKLNPKVKSASMKGRTTPLNAKMDKQNTPPFRRLHCKIR